ncbi:MAG: hypothetical protein ACKVU1_12565 [bacterium]
MKRAIPWMCVLSVVLASVAVAQPDPDPTDLDLDGLLGIAAPVPEADAPEVLALQGVGSMLIERGHIETFDVSGFTSFLETQGWTVETNTIRPVTVDLLTPYDIVMIPVGTTNILPFVSSEVEAFESYVQGGGGVWIFHDSGKPPSGINSLASAFGITFYNDTVIDSTDNEDNTRFWPRISELAVHPATDGVSSFGYYAGCCLSVSPPAFILGSGDADAYSANCNTSPTVLAAYEAGGRVVFSGDNTPLFPSYYPERLRDEEELLLQNIVNWLLGEGPTATTPASWGRIKHFYSAETD